MLLYLVLFFSGFSSLGRSTTLNDSIPFSTVLELSRILNYTLPGLALLWYLILKKKCLSFSSRELKPQIKDAYSFFWGFPGLVITGLGISLTVARLSPSSDFSGLQAPTNVSGWITVAISCIGTGYFEESYFRFYLLQKLEEWISFRFSRIALSVLLFALCHVYEGPWGILNAVLAGTLLSLLFERYKSLHGIALAHAGYNAFIYLAGYLFRFL